MRFAFYKGKDTTFDKLCSWKMEGKYVHVEAMFGSDPANPLLTICGSSTFTEHGVRIKSLDLRDTALWDIIEVPGLDEEKSFKWFKLHTGQPYNTRGLIQFISLVPCGNTTNGWFCDQACLASIGMTDSYRFDPNGMYDILQFLLEFNLDYWRKI